MTETTRYRIGEGGKVSVHNIICWNQTTHEIKLDPYEILQRVEDLGIENESINYIFSAEPNKACNPEDNYTGDSIVAGNTIQTEEGYTITVFLDDIIKYSDEDISDRLWGNACHEFMHVSLGVMGGWESLEQESYAYGYGDACYLALQDKEYMWYEITTPIGYEMDEGEYERLPKDSPIQVE